MSLWAGAGNLSSKSKDLTFSPFSLSKENCPGVCANSPDAVASDASSKAYYDLLDSQCSYFKNNQVGGSIVSTPSRLRCLLPMILTCACPLFSPQRDGSLIFITTTKRESTESTIVMDSLE